MQEAYLSPLLITSAALGEAYSKALGLPYSVMLEPCDIAGIFSTSNKVILTSILLASEVGGYLAVIPAITPYAMTSYVSLHILQPAVSHDRPRARVSLMIILMCDEGRKLLEKYDALAVIKEGRIIGVVSIEGIERLLRRIMFNKCLGRKA